MTVGSALTLPSCNVPTAVPLALLGRPLLCIFTRLFSLLSALRSLFAARCSPFSPFSSFISPLFVTMVKVEIVDDKEESTSVYASSDSSRTGSTDSLSSITSEPESESLYQRIAALVDIIPPTTRYSISSQASKSAAVLRRTGKLAGNLIWMLTTSALLVGLPLALVLEDEAKITAQEKELIAQQQGAQQVILFSRFFPMPPCTIYSFTYFSCLRFVLASP